MHGPETPAARTLLRHAVAVTAYRGAKALRGAPPEFALFRAGEGSRTPLEILSHVADLFVWARLLADGDSSWTDAEPAGWDGQVARFHAALAAFDARLADGAPLACPVERLLAGPVADALQHVGQITYLRRLAGCPIRGENYFRAEIETGRVGPDQPPPVREFD